MTTLSAAAPAVPVPILATIITRVRKDSGRDNHSSNSGRGWDSHCQSLVTRSTSSRMGFVPWTANVNFVLFCYKGVKADGTSTDCIANALLEKEYCICT